MREGYAFLAFTDRGETLAELLASRLGGEAKRAGKSLTIGAWTEENFRERAGLVFIGAVGIAVRAIAPFVRSKSGDPAVVAVDETGRFAIPLLSGHLGGANALAGKIADITGGEAIITTATDLQGAFAVDLWAKRQGMTVRQPDRIKQVSSGVLAGKTIRVDCRWEIQGEPPEKVEQVCSAAKKAEAGSRVSENPKADVLVDERERENTALQLIPRILTLGIGCRKGIGAEAIEESFERFCRERKILPEAIRAAASIDRKSEEEGLLRFCRNHGWKVCFFSKDELSTAEGSLSTSDFVQSVVGVDNVCERAAILESGGKLIEAKYAGNGVTFALAEKETSFDWSW